MAKKKAKKKIVKQRPKKSAARVEAATPSLVFFELRDVAGVRYHSDHVDIERARIAARALVTSSDVSQAWIVRDVEIFRSPGS